MYCCINQGCDPSFPHVMIKNKSSAFPLLNWPKIQPIKGFDQSTEYIDFYICSITFLSLLLSVDGKPPNFLTKAAIGMTAGAVGSFIGTPAEISLIRMTADGRYRAFYYQHLTTFQLFLY